MDVFPLTRAAITSDDLLVLASPDLDPDPASESIPRDVSFIVKRPPAHGRLLYRDIHSDTVRLKGREGKKIILNWRMK